MDSNRVRQQPSTPGAFPHQPLNYLVSHRIPDESRVTLNALFSACGVSVSRSCTRLGRNSSHDRSRTRAFVLTPEIKTVCGGLGFGFRCCKCTGELPKPQARCALQAEHRLLQKCLLLNLEPSTATSYPSAKATLSSQGGGLFAPLEEEPKEVSSCQKISALGFLVIRGMLSVFAPGNWFQLQRCLRQVPMP